jgi:Flp pilus assembly protein TadG
LRTEVDLAMRFFGSAANIKRTNVLRRFARSERGATAIEFSLVAVPFFGLMFAILEIGITFFAQQTLDTAVQMSARLIRTGIAQEQNYDSNTFKNTICDRVGIIFDCGKLKIDVRTIATFDSNPPPPPFDQDGNLTDQNFVYTPGKGGEIVLVRAFYEWPSTMKLVYFSLANTGNGNYLMAASAAFKNEPFPW